MSTLEVVISMLVGYALGLTVYVGGVLLYLKWKARR